MKNEIAIFFGFRNMKIFSYLKYEKFHLQIFSTTLHKNNLFLDMNVHYLSKKQPRTYFLWNLWKILDMFVNEIFHISNMEKSSYFEIEKKIAISFSMLKKNLFRTVFLTLSTESYSMFLLVKNYNCRSKGVTFYW